MDNLALQNLLRAELLKHAGTITLSETEKQILNTYLGVSGNNPEVISPATSTALQSQPAEELEPPPEKEVIVVKDDGGILSGVEKLFLQLYREYVKKDEGKQLASELGKFARFTQSEVAKTSNVVAH